MPYLKFERYVILKKGIRPVIRYQPSQKPAYADDSLETYTLQVAETIIRTLDCLAAGLKETKMISSHVKIRSGDGVFTVLMDDEGYVVSFELTGGDAGTEEFVEWLFVDG